MSDVLIEVRNKKKSICKCYLWGYIAYKLRERKDIDFLDKDVKLYLDGKEIEKPEWLKN